MAGTKTRRADLEAERSAMWARLAGLNAELEAPVSRDQHISEALGITEDAFREWRGNLTTMVAGHTMICRAYRRLYRVASPIRDGLRRECDHVVYEGNTEAADALRDELGAAEVAMGAFLNADDEDEREADHD